MNVSSSKLLPRLGTLVFGFVSIGCFALALAWPSFAKQLFSSRLFAGLVGFWAALSAVLLYPAVARGLAGGMRDFWKGVRAGLDDFNNSL